MDTSVESSDEEEEDLAEEEEDVEEDVADEEAKSTVVSSAVVEAGVLRNTLEDSATGHVAEEEELRPHVHQGRLAGDGGGSDRERG